MTDDEILAHYRKSEQDPTMTLKRAKELYRIAQKYRHLKRQR